MSDIFARLKAPFPPDRISWRVGSTTADKKRGLALAYIDARDVMERLDDVVGPAGWQNDYPHANGKTMCRIGLYLVMCEGTDDDHGSACYEWVWKSDGAGDTDVEAEKGALSDAFKRAAVRWGIGRYLYDVPSPWVELEPVGLKSHRIKDSELPKLQRLLGGMAPTAPAAPVASAPDHKADADNIIAQVRACSTEDDIKAIGRSTKHIYDTLSQSEQVRIVKAGQERKAFLQSAKDRAA